jgi:hypothetical protein
MDFFIKKTFLFKCLLFLAFPLFAHQNPLILRAKKQMDNAEYTSAQEIISRGLFNSNLSTKDRVDLHWLQAICLISSGLVGSAKASFLKLLELEPMFQPDLNISPKILTAFSDAKDQFFSAGGSDSLYQPKMSPIENPQKEINPIFSFKIGNIERVTDIARVVIYLRKQGNSAYSSLDLYPDIEIKGLYSVNLASDLQNNSRVPYAFEYYVEALSKEATRLTGIGRRDSPLSFVINPPGKETEDHKLVTSSQTLYWPHWLGISTMVIGGIVLGIVSYSAPQENSLKITVAQATGDSLENI